MALFLRIYVQIEWDTWNECVKVNLMNMQIGNDGIFPFLLCNHIISVLLDHGSGSYLGSYYLVRETEKEGGREREIQNHYEIS